MDEISQQKIHVINDVSSRPDVLKGMSLEEPRVDNQCAKANANMNKTEEIKKKISQLNELRAESSKNLEHARSKEQEWMEIEKEMYKSIQPFSMPALQSQLNHAVNESEMLSDSLSSSFIENESPGNLNDFIKSYRAERKTYHLRKEYLERWSEERVGRAV